MAIHYEGTEVINGVRRVVIDHSPKTKQITKRKINKSAKTGKTVSEEKTEEYTSPTYETEVDATPEEEDDNAKDN